MIVLSYELKDSATPALKALEGRLSDRTELHRHVAAAAEHTTREHMVTIDPSMHTTRSRLGVPISSPPSYWQSRINAVESRADSNAATVSLGSEAEIFSRVDGPVLVRPRVGKYLTIPATAAAYGRRAREIAGLFAVTFKSGSKALAQKDGSDSKKLKVFYWLKESVTLPQDRELLPSDEQYLNAAEQGARDFVDAMPGGAA